MVVMTRSDLVKALMVAAVRHGGLPLTKDCVGDMVRQSYAIADEIEAKANKENEDG